MISHTRIILTDTDLKAVSLVEERGRVMNIGKARAIFENINSDEYSDADKALAIYIIMYMETHNSVTKASMLKVIRWLWDRQFEFNFVEDDEGGAE